jgi:hypothetical protein
MFWYSLMPPIRAAAAKAKEDFEQTGKSVVSSPDS